MGKQQIAFLRGVLAGIVLFGVIVFITKDKGISPPQNINNGKIEALNRTIDSLTNILPDDSVIIKYEQRIDTIYKSRDEKIDSIISLEPDSKLEFFSRWLSEMDCVE